MIDVTGDLWTYDAHLRVITTNGTVNARGQAVMGRGCAWEAAKRCPLFPRDLGEYLQQFGNHVQVFAYAGEDPIATMPVKYHWRERADLALIARSARELKTIVDRGGWKRVVMPRPGCGNGALAYADVRPVLAALLDDRFHVITFS